MDEGLVDDEDLPVGGSVLALRVVTSEHPVVVGPDVGPEVGEVLRDDVEAVAGVVVRDLPAKLALKLLRLLGRRA